MAEEYIPNRWTVGPYEFQEIEFKGGHPWAGRLMYRYLIDGKRVDAEVYPSLDRAIVSAVGAKYMGPRGAGGNAVGTAADWFMIMVGATEDEEPAPPKRPGFCEALDCPWTAPHAAGLPDGCTGGSAPEVERVTLANEDGTCRGSRAGWMTTESAVGGYVAKCRTCGQRASELGARPELAGDRYLGWTPEHKFPVER